MFNPNQLTERKKYESPLISIRVVRTRRTRLGPTEPGPTPKQETGELQLTNYTTFPVL